MRALRCTLEDTSQPAGVRVGQRLDQGCVHKGENTEAGAQAQSQHEDSRGSESGILGELPEGEAKVLQQVVHQVQLPHIAALLFPLFEFGKDPQRRTASILGRHAGGNVLRHLPLYVVREFLVEFLFHSLPREQ